MGDPAADDSVRPVTSLRARRVLWVALAVAVLGIVGSIVGWSFDPDRVRQAYLVAFVAAITVCLGALVLLCIIHLMNARWPVVIRRFIEALIVPLPLLAVAFVPLAWWTADLFPWAQPLADGLPAHVREAIEHHRPWFHDTAFQVRAAVYLGSWVVGGALLVGGSLHQDRGTDRDLPRRARVLAAASLPLHAFTITFAAFDWVMSLEPAWLSSVFGLYLFCGGLFGAVAILIIVVAAADRAHVFGDMIGPSHYSALGRVALASTALAGYLAFFQLLIIWLANEPLEVEWYLHRVESGWGRLAVVVLALHLVVPLLALLSYQLKRRRAPLTAIAIVMLLGHVLHVHWTIVPARPDAVVLHWIDAAVLLAFAGVLVAFVALGLWGRAAVPVGDPRLAQGARYVSR